MVRDVCEVLGLAQPTRAVERLDEDEVNQIHLTGCHRPPARNADHFGEPPDCRRVTTPTQTWFAAMPILHRDYETRGILNLSDVGTWRYSKHPSTDVWCCAFAVDDEPVKLWVPGDPVPPEFVEAANNPDWLASAFNDNFERLIETHIMRPRYGWPIIPIERHRCTQAAALSLALPAKLEKVALVLGLERQKDRAGHLKIGRAHV